MFLFLSHREKRESHQDSHEETEETEEDERISQGKTLLKVLDLGVKSSNIMIDYIISRIFQFVQG